MIAEDGMKSPRNTPVMMKDRLIKIEPALPFHHGLRGTRTASYTGGVISGASSLSGIEVLPRTKVARKNVDNSGTGDDIRSVFSSK